MSIDPATSLNDQLARTANPASSTQSELRRDELISAMKPAIGSGEAVTLASREKPALPAVSAAIQADKNDDLAEMPKAASDQYRVKYAAVMREFREGKLQVIVKDRNMAVAIAAERAAKADAGQQQKHSWNQQKRPASGVEQKDVQ